MLKGKVIYCKLLCENWESNWNQTEPQHDGKTQSDLLRMLLLGLWIKYTNHVISTCGHQQRSKVKDSASFSCNSCTKLTKKV